MCTGALILAAVALLEGRQATTHWAYHPLHWAYHPLHWAYHRLLERLGATYVPQRWVEDSKFITSAGQGPVMVVGGMLGETGDYRCSVAWWGDRGSGERWHSGPT